MYKFLFSIGLFALIILSCNQQSAEFTAQGANYFGDKVNPEGAKSLSTIDTPISTADTMNVLVEGTINEVCQAKGCWMTLDGTTSGDPVFIKFKDYAFFVPKDASGEAVVQGKLYANITSVDELRHYAEDKGQSDEEIAAITEPKSELRMMADGVLIYND